MTELITSLWREDSGQDMAEYALLIVLIALVVAAAVAIVGPEIADAFTRVGDELGE